MSVILARLHERQAPGAQMVHIFAAEQDSPDGMRKAYCGFTAHYSWLKSVSGLAGMPCELCLLDAPLKVAETSAEVIELSTEIDMAGPLFAIGLRGERVWHEVPSDPIVGDYESRSVVLTVCGCVGWLMPGDPYPDWSRCRECDETRGVSASGDNPAWMGSVTDFAPRAAASLPLIATSPRRPIRWSA